MDQIILVSFTIGDNEYALDISEVQEVVRYQEITPLPRVPDYILGVINLRGKIIPIIDLGKRIGVESSKENSKKIIIVKKNNELYGLLVDKVKGVLKVSGDEIEDVRYGDLRLSEKYIKGLIRKDNNIIIILNLDNILSSEV